MLKGNLMVDALIGLVLLSYSVILMNICVQTYAKVEAKYLSKWQVEECVCEIWCDSFWFYDD